MAVGVTSCSVLQDISETVVALVTDEGNYFTKCFGLESNPCLKFATILVIVSIRNLSSYMISIIKI